MVTGTVDVRRRPEFTYDSVHVSVSSMLPLKPVPVRVMMVPPAILPEVTVGGLMCRK